MKVLRGTYCKWTLALGMGLIATSLAAAAEKTAFDLVKEANRYVGEDARDKVVQIRSEKSVGSMVPNIWYVVMYDPDATFKATEVKFGAGKKLSVKRPMRMLEPVSGGDAPLDRDKLKIDSDKAIKLATEDPMLTNLKLTAVQLKLERVGEGVLGITGPGQGVWKVRLYAQKLRDPSRDADIGEIWIAALDGKEIKNDLHINRVD